MKNVIKKISANFSKLFIALAFANLAYATSIGTIGSLTAINENNIYAGTYSPGKCDVYGINLSATNPTWLAIGKPFIGCGNIPSALTSENKIYIGTAEITAYGEGGNVYVADVSSTHPVWTPLAVNEIPDHGYASRLSVMDKKLFVGTQKGHVYIADTTLKSPVWIEFSSALNSPISGLQSIGKKLYVATRKGEVYVADASALSPSWVALGKKLPGFVYSFSALHLLKENQVKLYASVINNDRNDRSNAVYTYDISSNNWIKLGNMPNHETISSVTTMASTNALYVSTNYGKVYMYDDSSGLVVWKQVGSANLGVITQLFSIDNKIFAGNTMGQVYGMDWIAIG